MTGMNVWERTINIVCGPLGNDKIRKKTRRIPAETGNAPQGVDHLDLMLDGCTQLYHSLIRSLCINDKWTHQAILHFLSR